MSGPAVLENLDWVEDAVKAIQAEARTGQTFDSYAAQQHQGLEPPPSPSLWGTAFKIAAHRGIIQEAGFQISTRPTRRGGITRLWIGSPAYLTNSNGVSAVNTDAA